MTWSIVAREPATGRFGIAISTKAFAVGAVCPWILAGIGAISTQAHTNPLLGALGLDLMARGVPVEAALATLLGRDEGRAVRQVHGVDAAGRVFAHTGPRCVEWCGHAAGTNVSVAGNMLAGPRVVSETLRVFEEGGDLDFPDRLLTALEAGAAAGGDKRGKQSAALRMFGAQPYAELDIRVDDHGEPIAELRRLYRIWAAERRPYMQTMATVENFSGIFDPVERERIIEAWKRANGGA